MKYYCQVVTGSPGVGKSTYCDGMQQFLHAAKRTNVHIINLDPAAAYINYNPSIDIKELISVIDVMDELHLGPNGSLLYCMEFLEKNIEWLITKIQLFATTTTTSVYIIIDCPGQVETFVHHNSLKHILYTIRDKFSCQMVLMHLTDVQYCTNVSNFISTILLSLSVLINMELPTINILSKYDLLPQYATTGQ